ncbi:MAG TPA: hypothetical protein PKG95_00985, partial [Anaerolineaceae bacterium]|nr:hypothetical protein [Anaerolineaceae bacterium]
SSDIITCVSTSTKPSALHRAMHNLFLLTAIFGLIMGLINLLGLVSGFNPTYLADGLFNLAFAVANFAGYRLMTNRSRTVIWLQLVITLAGLLYGPLVGRGLALQYPIIGLIYLFILITLRRRGEIQ